MRGIVERGDMGVDGASAGRRHLSDRLARYALFILLLSVAIAVVGGTLIAVAWQPRAQEVQSFDECPNPPCFGGGGLPRGQDLPWALSTVGYVLAILLGLPGLLAGAWAVLRGRWAVGGRRALTFAGPVLVFVLNETLPHLLNPCGLPYALGSRNLPGFCQTNPAWGADVQDRYHLLDHALAGGLPAVGLYWLALRKWHPTIAPPRSR